MDAEIKKKWLEALRSGKYTQTTGVLRNDVAHCCLGVLCDVIDPSKWGEEGYGDSRVYYGNDDTIPPADVLLAAGLTSTQADKLVNMNDGHCGERTHSFDEIADHIEKNF